MPLTGLKITKLQTRFWRDSTRHERVGTPSNLDPRVPELMITIPESDQRLRLSAAWMRASSMLPFRGRADRVPRFFFTGLHRNFWAPGSLCAGAGLLILGA
jgi:hypothetical protein